MSGSRLDPAAEAQKVLDGMGVDSAPIPVERIARSLGAQLRFSPLDDELSGMIFMRDGAPIIGVNAVHHPNRQRFTIAHECGHLVMHHDRLSNVVHVDKQFPVLMRDQRSATGTELMEIQANKFAAALLMPARLFDQEVSSLSFDIDDDAPFEELAKKFKVSRQAVELRIRSLGHWMI
ncbi:ImmA/IrrE family metallo-endopeptidase [Rhizobium laguerreae]|uniref:ImmA/IrrE family metallo-endopeptidase n=1 Tax=Rhizobium laguerreae TaxID=1076926 RepID=UPI001C8FBAAD|nr:ImmA/IrrE family metallo-endopeptidase [Rhizobium laguerreae]MBY3201338.1 ImmA/IrrE family metallo-endopeptidase [Rhizobium laguerreae]